jgi:methionine-rich copper-binding protein CopC
VKARGAAAFLIAAAMGVGVPQIALSHAALVRSTPSARATLSRLPARVELWFNERLEPAYSSLSVQNASGLPVDQRDVTVGPEDRRRLSVGIPTLAPGRYVVRYRVLSVDGHVVESTFAFTVKRAA